MSTEIKFETKTGLSASDFGNPRVARDSEQKFRSFGVAYEQGMVWMNDENWYNAWRDGQVIPRSITMRQVQRVRNKIDPATGQVMMANGKKITEIVTQEMLDADPSIGGNTWVWEITKLQTLAQLKGEADVVKQLEDIEDDAELRKVTRTYDLREKKLSAISKYHETASKAAQTAVIGKEQEERINALLAGIEK